MDGCYWKPMTESKYNRTAKDDIWKYKNPEKRHRGRWSTRCQDVSSMKESNYPVSTHRNTSKSKFDKSQYHNAEESNSYLQNGDRTVSYKSGKLKNYSSNDSVQSKHSDLLLPSSPLSASFTSRNVMYHSQSGQSPSHNIQNDIEFSSSPLAYDYEDSIPYSHSPEQYNSRHILNSSSRKAPLLGASPQHNKPHLEKSPLLETPSISSKPLLETPSISSKPLLDTPPLLRKPPLLKTPPVQQFNGTYLNSTPRLNSSPNHFNLSSYSPENCNDNYYYSETSPKYFGENSEWPSCDIKNGDSSKSHLFLNNILRDPRLVRSALRAERLNSQINPDKNIPLKINKSEKPTSVSSSNKSNLVKHQSPSTNSTSSKYSERNTPSTYKHSAQKILNTVVKEEQNSSSKKNTNANIKEEKPSVSVKGYRSTNSEKSVENLIKKIYCETSDTKFKINIRKQNTGTSESSVKSTAEITRENTAFTDTACVLKCICEKNKEDAKQTVVKIEKTCEKCNSTSQSNKNDSIKKKLVKSKVNKASSNKNISMIKKANMLTTNIINKNRKPQNLENIQSGNSELLSANTNALTEKDDSLCSSKTSVKRITRSKGTKNRQRKLQLKGNSTPEVGIPKNCTPNSSKMSGSQTKKNNIIHLKIKDIINTENETISENSSSEIIENNTSNDVKNNNTSSMDQILESESITQSTIVTTSVAVESTSDSKSKRPKLTLRLKYSKRRHLIRRLRTKQGTSADGKITKTKISNWKIAEPKGESPTEEDNENTELLENLPGKENISEEISSKSCLTTARSTLLASKFKRSSSLANNVQKAKKSFTSNRINVANHSKLYLTNKQFRKKRKPFKGGRYDFCQRRRPRKKPFKLNQSSSVETAIGNRARKSFPKPENVNNIVHITTHNSSVFKTHVKPIQPLFRSSNSPLVKLENALKLENDSRGEYPKDVIPRTSRKTIVKYSTQQYEVKIDKTISSIKDFKSHQTNLMVQNVAKKTFVYNSLQNLKTQEECSVRVKYFSSVPCVSVSSGKINSGVPVNTCDIKPSVIRLEPSPTQNTWSSSKDSKCLNWKYLCSCVQKPMRQPCSLSEGQNTCQAIDTVDENEIPCSNILFESSFARASYKLEYIDMCQTHLLRLRHHQCCPLCGVFCSQGIFLRCKSVQGNATANLHFFHRKCLQEPLCPHCGKSNCIEEIRLAVYPENFPSNFSLSELTNSKKYAVTYYLQETVSLLVQT